MIFRISGSLIECLGHIGFWAGLYVTAAYVCFWQLASVGKPGSFPHWSVVIAVLLSATAVYAVDRVKLIDAWIDPADCEAQPQRYAFLTRHTSRVRGLAALLLAGAMLLSLTASPLLPVVIAISMAGVVLYAPGPRGRLPRPKDLLGLKNILVAGGVVGLTIIATVLIGPLSRVHGDAFWQLARIRIGPLGDAAILLLLRVLIDAIICDIDDSTTDAAYGTRTLPGIWGAQRTFRMAIAARIILAGMILLLARTELWVRFVWAGTNALSAIALIAFRNKNLRDVVDVNFAVEALIIGLIASVWAN